MMISSFTPKTLVSLATVASLPEGEVEEEEEEGEGEERLAFCRTKYVLYDMGGRTS